MAIRFQRQTNTWHADLADEDALRKKLQTRFDEARALGLDSTQARAHMGNVILGGEKKQFNSVTQSLQSPRGNLPRWKNVAKDAETKRIRAAQLAEQTPKYIESLYGKTGRRVLKLAGQEDHHMLFRILFAPFYKGLNEREAAEMTQTLYESGFPLGNIEENLTYLDKDLHKQLHGWAIENQIQVSNWSMDEWEAGERNIMKGLARGGADNEIYVNPKKLKAADRKAGIREIPQAQFPAIADLPDNVRDRVGLFEQRKREAIRWGDLIHDPLLEKTSEIMTEQEVRTFGAARSRKKQEILQELVDKNRRLSTVARLEGDMNLKSGTIRGLIGADMQNLSILEESLTNMSKMAPKFRGATSVLGVGDAFAQSALGFARGDFVGGTVAGTLGAAQLAGQSAAVQKRFAKLAGELIAKRGSKSALKFIPGVDIALSGAESWGYLTEGKWDQAGIAALSGAIGWVPGMGDFGAALLDATNTAIDIKRMDLKQKGDAPDLTEDLPDTDPKILKRNRMANMIGEASDHYDPGLFRTISGAIN
tara:strand:- start:175 stop:1782 length:1608 start_codon:yes stop_codon:yes gene_type:complete